MMLLIGLLATASLFMVVNSAPTMFTTNQREKDVDNDHLLLVFLLNRRDGALKPMPFDSGNDSGPAHLRNKRIGSLSIVNSIEVLRDRVLLELARRKAMQDQRQINENRKLMDQIGKRSYVNPAAGSTGPQTDKSIFSKINLDEPNEITYHEGQSKKLPTQIPCESCPDLLRPENDPLQRLLLVL